MVDRYGQIVERLKLNERKRNERRLTKHLNESYPYYYFRRSGYWLIVPFRTIT
jgi:hypothetical protein